MSNNRLMPLAAAVLAAVVAVALPASAQERGGFRGDDNGSSRVEHMAGPRGDGHVQGGHETRRVDRAVNRNYDHSRSRNDYRRPVSRNDHRATPRQDRRHVARHDNRRRDNHFNQRANSHRQNRFDNRGYRRANDRRAYRPQHSNRMAHNGRRRF